MNTVVENHFIDAASNRHLDWLESEAIHIMREVAAECTNPALCFQVVKILWCYCVSLKKPFVRVNSLSL